MRVTSEIVWPIRRSPWYVFHTITDGFLWTKNLLTHTEWKSKFSIQRFFLQHWEESTQSHSWQQLQWYAHYYFRLRTNINTHSHNTYRIENGNHKRQLRTSILPGLSTKSTQLFSPFTLNCAPQTWNYLQTQENHAFLTTHFGNDYVPIYFTVAKPSRHAATGQFRWAVGKTDAGWWISITRSQACSRHYIGPTRNVSVNRGIF